MITIGLRELIRRKSYPAGLAANGYADYDGALKESRRIAAIARAGKRPPNEGACLFHHLYGVEDVAAEERGRALVTNSLNAFETSTALSFLAKTNFDRCRQWETILTDTEDIPWFLSDGKLGFENAIGLRVYASYDLALHHGSEYYVIDWKAGNKSAASLSAARRQLAVYGLWAMAQGIPIQDIRVQAFYLQDGEPWLPQPLDIDDVKSVIKQIEEQDTFERAATTAVANSDGEIVRYDADREDFPTRPDLVRCGWCPYQSICADGKATVVQKTPISGAVQARA